MNSTISLPLLDRVGVASPCHARWDDMTGDERVRHCADCNLSVHNISALSRKDAEQLLRASVGDRLCIRLFRRADGTILTQDCPVGFARVRAGARRALVRVGVLVGLVGLAGAGAASTSRGMFGDRVRLRALRPFSVVCEWIAPSVAPAPPPMMGAMVMGIMAWPTPRPTPPVPSGAPTLGRNGLQPNPNCE